MANNQHFEFSGQLSTSVSTLFVPATANYLLVCVHTTLNKPIEMHFTGKFRKIENEC